MATYAMVNDQTGTVDNVIVWDGNTDPETGGWEPPPDYTMVEVAEGVVAVGKGWTYDGATFIDPNAPPPSLPKLEE